ncbi:4-hydroxybenzoate 3-monooxygenase [Rubrivivax rivuli]|uniref:4-hydroxybenzoate 3-monooxygenase n=1 Tax=Rubrivivax rivuli TaxID=1862385 RepID=A0A437RL74_9BURK|nr:4-hydroxybenzoate 3-monooxygenase [Rubrivivax rivuli]RVU47546.1 4-hydroxybenzoate 3-monooxygenase [Rubrivivax rivuli]
MKTQVVIIGSGPAGLLLSEILHRHGIESLVLERQTREYVLSRIRAGVLESTTVDVLRANGLSERMDREGHPHDGMRIAWAGRDSFLVDTASTLGRRFMVYGQTAIQEDLYAAADRRGQTVLTEVQDVVLHEFDGRPGAKPYVTYTRHGQAGRVDCEFIAGCDGFHGVSRRSIPESVRKEYEKVYPFGWLGVMARVKPLPDITYVNHPQGFALASYRNSQLSRYYIQVPVDDKVEAWSDDRFWSELTARFPAEMAEMIETGPTIEKSIAPLRSFVSEPMRYGALYLCGDAAHIVPPTGAKGLNLAVSDVFYLSRALASWYGQGKDELLNNYSAMALRRVWSSVRTSWYLTTLLHRFPHFSDFDQKAQEHELDYLKNSRFAQAALAEQYAGLPFEMVS